MSDTVAYVHKAVFIGLGSFIFLENVTLPILL